MNEIMISIMKMPSRIRRGCVKYGTKCSQMINFIFIIDHYKRTRDKYKVIDKTLYQLLNWALKSATYW